MGEGYGGLTMEKLIACLPEIAAIIISVISLIISYNNYKFNQEANKILKLRFDSEAPQFELFLNEQLMKQKDDCIEYFFSILISNMSDKKNSIRNLELEIHYKFGERDNSIKFDCNSVRIINQESIIAHLPIDIDERSSKRIDITFNVPIALRNDKDIISYSVNVYDVFQNKTTVDAMLVNEVLL